MTKYNNPISINYTYEKQRLLVEEYIIQQRADFTFEGVCSYILYWAMEEGKAEQDGKTTFDNIAINESDQRRVSNILDAIVSDG